MNYPFTGRTNILTVPTAPDGSLIVALCGGTGSPTNMQTTTQLETVFPNKYILYVAPDTNAGSLWRIGDAAQVDFHYINGLVNSVTSQYIIPYANVSFVGVSLGAIMALRIVNILDEVPFKGVVCISGVYQSPETYDAKTKVLMVNNINDATVPFDGNSTYVSVPSTYRVIAKSLDVFEPVLIGKSSGDNHSYLAIKAAYPALESKIQGFLA